MRNPRNKGFLIFLCIIAGVIFLAVMSSFINVGNYISIPFVGNDTQKVIYEVLFENSLCSAIYE